MNKLLTAMLSIAGLLALPSLAHATVTLNLSGGVFYGNNGTVPLPVNSTVVLLADVDGDGFGDLTQSTSSFKADVDDVIIGRFGTNDFGDAGAGTVATAITGIQLTGLLGQNDALMLVWYDLPYSPGATGPGPGVFFGQYTDASLKMPADGASVFVRMETVNNSGSLPESAGRATLQTSTGAAIPEPASLAAVALGGIMMLARRRRRA